jgi:hypothetical protein
MTRDFFMASTSSWNNVIRLAGMRKNWFLYKSEEEVILALARRYDNHSPKALKIYRGF